LHKATNGVDASRFSALLAARYPHVVADFDEVESASVYLQLGALARFTQQAMSEEDTPIVADYFAFIGQMFRLGDGEVKNAIAVSYLECLGFDGRHGKRIGAREMLTPQLRTTLCDLEKYNAAIRRGPDRD
jgi:hypothetical protein